MGFDILQHLSTSCLFRFALPFPSIESIIFAVFKILNFMAYICFFAHHRIKVYLELRTFIIIYSVCQHAF